MRLICLFVAGLILGWAPPLTFAAAARVALPEPAFRDNFYGVTIRGQQAWIVGYYGTVLYSQDRGESWALQRTNTRRALFRVAFVTDYKGWIAGSDGTVLQTSDGGKTWQLQNTRTSEHLFGIDFLDENNGWGVGSRGTILRTQDGGASWTSLSLKEDIILNSVSFTTPARGWISGEFGVILRTDNGGKNWSKQKSPVEVAFASGESSNLFFLLFSGQRQGWAFGLDGTILKTADGERWQIAHKNRSPNQVTSHHLFAATALNGELWAVGERGTVIRSPRAKDDWRKAQIEAPPLSLNTIAFGADGFGLMAGNRGLILRTLDGGKRWQRIGITGQQPDKDP